MSLREKQRNNVESVSERNYAGLNHIAVVHIGWVPNNRKYLMFIKLIKCYESLLCCYDNETIKT